MDFLEVVERRKSIRSYKTTPVPGETVKKVLAAALRAPSWANKQCWRFIAVEGKAARTLLGKATGQAGPTKAFETAPLVIALCADPAESGTKNYMEYYMFDCGLAMENLMLAAAAEGLGTCNVGWFDEKAAKVVLNVPENFRVVSLTPLGYPDEDPASKGRKHMNELVFLNTWGKEYK